MSSSSSSSLKFPHKPQTWQGAEGFSVAGQGQVEEPSFLGGACISTPKKKAPFFQPSSFLGNDHLGLERAQRPLEAGSWGEELGFVPTFW